MRAVSALYKSYRSIMAHCFSLSYLAQVHTADILALFSCKNDMY